MQRNGIYTVYFRPAGDGTAEDGYTYVPFENDGTGLDAHGCKNGGYLFKFVKTDEYTPTEAPTVAPDETMTVYFKNNLNWENVNAYYWGSAAESVDWPGIATEDAGNGFVKAVVPNDITGLIFNGTGAQTVNIEEGLTDGAAWALTGEQDGSNYKVEPAATTMIVYFVDALGWGDVNAYYWGSSFGSVDWPGEAATVVENIVDTDGHTVYGAEVPLGITGLIFNGNGNQTVNIETGLVDGAVWHTTGEKEGNNFVVAEGLCPAAPETYLLGDADGDEDVSSVDSTVIQRVIAEFNVPIDEATLLQGDVDGSGELEVVDATLIQRWLADFVVPYPIGEYVTKE